METKDQTPQNPEKKKEQVQEENSTSVKKQDETKTETNSEVASSKNKKKTEVSPEEKKSEETAANAEQKASNPEVPTDITKDSESAAAKKASVKTKKSESPAATDVVHDEKPDVTDDKKKELLAEKTEDTASPKEEDIKADKTKEVTIDELEEGNDDEEEHEEEDIDYDSCSNDELIAYLENTVNKGEINKIKRKVALIKVSFLKNIKEASENAYKKFIEDGGDKNEYKAEDNPLLSKFNEIFNIYKKKRSEYLKEQDKIKIENLDAKKLILEELKTLIDSEETLKKTYDEFKALQEKWKEIGMVPQGEVNNLWQSYHFFVEKFFDKVKINRELRDLDMKKNLELKIRICEKTEELLLESSIIKSFKQLQIYHQQWKEIGPVVQDKKDEIWERFKDTTNKINQRRREHYNNLQEEQNNNLTAKTALCEKIEVLIQDELTTIKEWQNKTTEVTDLLKVWKTIGPAPRKQNDEIWSRFKSSLNTFFANKKEYFKKIKDEQLNNYNLKLELCVQAEALQSSTEWKNTTRDLIALQKEWKEIGPVPRKHSDKIWKRFRAACDTFFNNKSDYFSNINKHESDNLKLKTELIQKVESYKSGADKNENLSAIKEFQREWTTIGHVPIKEKDKMHNEFRTAINKQLDQLNISKNELQTLNYKTKVDSFKENPNSKRIISSERTFLFNKKKKMEEEINLWENNLGFFAESKQASLLKEEFEKKIEKAKRDIEIINAKIKMLNTDS